jgi:tetratricopeptide (TPR) repeat protein
MSRHKSFLYFSLFIFCLSAVTCITFALISPLSYADDSTIRREEIHSQIRKGTELYYQNRYDQAVEVLSQAIAREASAGSLYQAYIHRGAALGYLGQIQKARKDFERALQINFKDPFLYYMRAVTVFAAQKEFDPAIEDFNYALALHPNSSLTLSIYLSRSDCYAQKKEFDLARDDLNQALRLDPNNKAIFTTMNNLANHYSAMGDIFKRKGQYDQALRYYSEAIRLNSQNPRPFAGRAFVKILKGDKQNAISDLQASCNLGDQNVCRILEMLQK